MLINSFLSRSGLFYWPYLINQVTEFSITLWVICQACGKIKNSILADLSRTDGQCDICIHLLIIRHVLQYRLSFLDLLKNYRFP